MSTAHETLLEAAHAAVAVQPWTEVRMVDVAAVAGVSRQTLYNEFGSKEGLGTALVDNLVGGFVDGAVRAGADAGRGAVDPAACCTAAAAWMLRRARDEPIVYAALTGCWGSRMPLAAPGTRASANGGVPGEEPGELAAELCSRMVMGLAANGAGSPGARTAATASPVLVRACEAGLRVALSYVIAPPCTGEATAEQQERRRGMDEEACVRIGEVVRALLAR